MKQEVKIIKGPDGFYAGRILKSGLPSSDTHKVSDEEVCAMFEDVLRRHRADTGRSVLSIFNERKEPIFVAKLDPDIRECGILQPQRPPQTKTPQLRVPFARKVN
jgi:hypothetical protein